MDTGALTNPRSLELAVLCIGDIPRVACTAEYPHFYCAKRLLSILAAGLVFCLTSGASARTVLSDSDIVDLRIPLLPLESGGDIECSGSKAQLQLLPTSRSPLHHGTDPDLSAPTPLPDGVTLTDLDLSPMTAGHCTLVSG